MTLFSNVFANLAPQGSRRISGKDAWRMVHDGKAVFLDVRTAAEVAQGKVKGALTIPLDELSSRARELPKDKAVIVYCRSGGRSASAAAILGRKGVEVHDAGGIAALMR